MPKVLIVEDNEMNRDMLSRRLVRRGFDVIVAVDGKQGVDMAGSEKPDLILMDLSLPVLDGWEATRSLKAKEATRSIPVIALTSHAMTGDRSKALEVGCDEYDTKPVELTRLLSKMERLLKGAPRPDVAVAKTAPLTAEAVGHLRHDLKTSFNQILGYLEILLEDAQSDGLQQMVPSLNDLHTLGRTLLDRIDRALAEDQRVGYGELRLLANEIGPDIKKLSELSESLGSKIHSVGPKEALSDIGKVTSAAKILMGRVQEMRVESEPQTPQVAAVANGASAQAVAAGSHKHEGRLLVVEDDIINRDLLQRRLARSGYSVEVAESGQTALEMIKKAEFDLVLLDQMMPGMSGLDLLKLLRNTYTTNELPIIMVTAVDQKSTIVQALDQGANDYVSKPIDMPLVLARIQAQLARSKADQKSKLSDSLTGLENRLSLTARLGEALAASPATVGVVQIDLDGFKTVNDSFGRTAGDHVLVEVATRLKDVVRQSAFASKANVARVAGDEFAILVENIQDAEQLKGLAESILTRLNQPIMANGTRVEMNANVGIALGSSENVTPEYLLRDASLAVYRAKEIGKNRWSICEPMLRERAETHAVIATGLRGAVERGELFVVYQPKVTLKTGAIVGFEALLRWNHPERGLMHPADFIPVAEETGLIPAIGEWILQQACRQLKVWQKMFPFDPPLSMNVNLSVKQLSDPNLIVCLQNILIETGIAPQTLKLELTESSLMPEISTAREALASIKALQVGLKLDDFGTGYSSLSYLRKLHLDSLKIDKSFVDRVAFDPGSRAIVETVLDLAQALNMNVVAEGIEDVDQLRELIKLGCETGQGFYFSKPLKSDLAEKLLASRFGKPTGENGFESWATKLTEK